MLAVADKVEPAVTMVTTTFCGGSGTGSGFWVGPRTVMTAAHVVKDATDVRVNLAGSNVSARVIGRNDRADVAMLELQSGTFAGTPLIIATDDPPDGIPIVAVGHPEGGALTSSRGKVAEVGATATVEGVTRGRLIKTDALVSPGSSGGPLVGLDGKVYGVVHAGDAYDTEFGWAVSPVVAGDFERAWAKEPQYVQFSACAPVPTDAGPTGANSFGPSDVYNLCANPQFPLSRGLTLATSTPTGSPEESATISVQAALKALAYGSRTLAVDGDYGPQTAMAVRAFQRAAGLPVDGGVGPATWRALHDALCQ